MRIGLLLACLAVCPVAYCESITYLVLNDGKELRCESVEIIGDRYRAVINGKTKTFKLTKATLKTVTIVTEEAERQVDQPRSDTEPSSIPNKVADAEARAYHRYQLFVLEEVNFARTDPGGYAKKRLAEDHEARSDNGAYDELVKMKPVPALTLNGKLTDAAVLYAELLAAKNKFGHNVRGNVSSRISDAGYAASTLGENIACGSSSERNALETPQEAAVIFVKDWIIDRGVSGVGHRKNVLNPAFTETGVGFGRNPGSKYVNYLVQDFGSP